MGTSRAADDWPDNEVPAYRQAAPPAPRLLVGVLLRRLREARGFSRAEAGKAIGASASKLSRLEGTRTALKSRDVAELLTLYGVTDEAHRRAVLRLVQQTTMPSWWTRNPDVIPGWFEPYLGLELTARVIRVYTDQFIPDLLRTEDYARAVTWLSHYDDTEDQIHRRVRLVMHRQHILTRPDPPQLWAVIDETALRRPVGGAATHRAQLRHLIELTELPHVTVQVLPVHIAGHIAAGGPITVLRFPEDDLNDVVYLEQLTNAVYLDQPADVDHYWDIMNRLSVRAEPAAATTALLHRALGET
jgi:transcriptional regulator with XRE-family HTH domain